MIRVWLKNRVLMRWVGLGLTIASFCLFVLFRVGGFYSTTSGDSLLNKVGQVVCVAVGLLGLGLLLGSSFKKLLSYAGMTTLAAFLLAPFAWMVLVSLHPSKTPIPTLENLIPKAPVLDARNQPVVEPGPDGKPIAQVEVKPAWENYGKVLFMPNLPVFRFFLNTVFVTVCVVFGQLFISSLAAYGFARFKFRGRDLTFAIFLGSMMFAGPVTQIPVYLIVQKLGWLDTYAALIVPGLSSAFNVFLLRQAFLAIPKELDEAAKLDGAGYFRIYWRVLMPLAKPSLATAAAFTFFGVWTDFFWPLLSTNSTEMRTLEVGLSIFKNSYGAANWPLQMTAAVIVMLPLLLVFLFCQRYFVKGVMLGSIK